MERVPAPGNPLGAKGAGEGGIVPVGGVDCQCGGGGAEVARRAAERVAAEPAAGWAMINKVS